MPSRASASETDLSEQDMTSLSPTNTERLKRAFQECRDMEGTLNEQLEAYAAAGRETFPAAGAAVVRLVAPTPQNCCSGKAPPPGQPRPRFFLSVEPRPRAHR